MGPWYQKVNAAVRRAKTAKTADQLRNILGEPGTIESVPDNDRRESEDAPIDERYPAEQWVYVDPYRPRFHYVFGIFGHYPKVQLERIRSGEGQIQIRRQVKF